MASLRILTLALIAAVAASSHCLAANAWRNGVQISSIQPLEDGNFYIYGPAGMDNACSAGKVMSLKSGFNGQTAAGVKAVATVALLAITLGKPVNVYYDNSSSNCYINELELPT